MATKSKIVFLYAAMLASCNDAGFQSTSNEDTPPLPVTVQCEIDGSYNQENQVIPVATDKQSLKLEVTGEFCPQAPANLTLLFLIDFSLSMYNADVDPVRGNDQLIDGSCGRLDAAKAIVDRIEERVRKIKANVQIGVISFSSDIEDAVDPVSLSDFSSKLSPQKFCLGKGRTNYSAVFERAEEMLTDVEGTKVVYFITDGLPSLGGDAPAGLEVAHQEAAIDAAESLRGNVEKLTLNTVFLGNSFEEIDVDPVEVLNDVTGKASRVKIVESADKLAEEILKLDAPPISLDGKSVSARFENGLESPLPVKLVSFAPSPNRDQIWNFKTAPFEPFAADEGKPELIIEGVGDDGETYRVVFTIIPDLNPSPDEGTSDSSTP